MNSEEKKVYMTIFNGLRSRALNIAVETKIFEPEDLEEIYEFLIFCMKRERKLYDLNDDLY